MNKSASAARAIAVDAKPLTAAEARQLFAPYASAEALVLAVSGGPDSMALLLLAARWAARRRRPPRLVAVTIDHGLRAESAREARAVRAQARALGVTHRLLTWRGAKPATGLQAAARAARYGLLARAATAIGATHVLTAHTRDDQAETVLMRMARGSGLAGLAAMALDAPAGGVRVGRPFLTVPKARLIATLQKAGMAFADDASNRDPRFTRARWRGLMPALAAEGLDAAALVRLATRMARANTALDAAAEAAINAVVRREAGDARWTIAAAAFADLPLEIRLRVMGRAMDAAGHEGPVELGKLERFMDDLAAALARTRQTGPSGFRRTLAGAVVSLERGQIVVGPAPRRRARGTLRRPPA